MTTPTLRTQRPALAALAALLLAACGGGAGSSTQITNARLARGAVTAIASGTLTVNGVVLSTAGAAVRVDDSPGGIDDVRPGDVVTVKGTFDDRTGTATEIEVEHAIEGRVDDKGTDFLVVGGQRIQVDDTTHFDDRLSAGLDAVPVGTVVRISGTPVAGVPGAVDDQGGLRASRVERSPRADDGIPANDDDLDVKGFVSALDTGARTFQLRVSPDAAGWFAVSYAGATLPPGVANGAYVEVHTASAPAAGTPPVIASLAASSIQLEDRAAGGDVELEGYVTSVSGTSFVVAGVTVQTDGATRFVLGCPGAPWTAGCPSGDTAALVVGAKVEVEGPVDAAGILRAERVTFEAGVRITAVVQGYTGSALTLLGVQVQLPTWLENTLSVALGNGVQVEVRGAPSADGTGVVASRIDDPSGGSASRVFLRALVTAKGPESLTVLGFGVSTSGASLNGADGTPAASRGAWFAAIDPGHTVVKVRASSAADVDGGAKTWTADEVEVEGDD